MPKENELTNITTLSDSDEIRVLQSGSNSRNITYDNFKTDIGIAGKLNISDIDDTPANNANAPVSSQFNYKQTAQGDYAIGGADPWEIEFTSSSQVSISSPSVNTWYNPIGHQITLTAGTWQVEYKIAVNGSGATPNNSCEIRSTLSTVNNNQTDVLWSCAYFYGSSSTNAREVINTFNAKRKITVGSNTTYYLNIIFLNFLGTLNLKTRGDLAGTYLRAKRIY